MCGINGFWSKNSHEMNKGVFARFVDTLAHRGPDGSGIYKDESQNLWLGHRRLNIFDLSPSAKQPLSYLNERYHITFNGEIYNFIEIKKELESCGYKFYTNSDTEVLLASFVQWGEQCQLKFNGMWAFAIWDSQMKRLFVSRDRFGVKPFHYYHDNERFAFASELKSFLALPMIETEFDKEMVTLSVQNLHSTFKPTSTLLKNILHLEAGTCGWLTCDGQFKVKRWWNTLDHLSPSSILEWNSVKKFRSTFIDACKLRMRGDIPIGFCLSGGLDSSSVVSSFSYLEKHNALPHRCSSNWKNAFLALYPGTIQDESEYAQSVVDMTKVNTFSLKINPVALTESEVERLAYDFESIADLPFGPWLLYREFRRKNIFVSVDGHGGDELLGGYHQQLAALLSCYGLANPLRFFDLQRTYRGLYNKAKTPMAAVQSSARDILKKYVDPHQDININDPINRRLYFDFHKATLPVILRNFDRLSMAHGIEVRSPFMDWRLVCLSFGLSGKWKIGGGYTKRILRQAMKGILPNKVLYRKGKLGFANPLKEWLNEGLHKFCMDRICSSSFKTNPFFDGSKIKKEAEKIYEQGQYSELRNFWEYVVADVLITSFNAKRKEHLSALKQNQEVNSKV